MGDTIYYHNNEIKDMIVIKGKESLNYYIQYLLEQELSQKQPQVYYIGQNQYDFFGFINEYWVYA